MSDDDNVVPFPEGEKFKVSEPRRKDETRQEYLNRYRREKKKWERAHGIPAPKRDKVRLSKTETAIRAGEVDFSKLSIEELVRGQLKAVNGKFVGRPSKMLSREFHQQAMKEILKRGDELFQEAYVAAVSVMVQIAIDPTLEPKDRRAAAQYVIERVGGKTPERLQISADDPWKVLVDGIVASVEDEQIAKAKEILNAGEEG